MYWLNTLFKTQRSKINQVIKDFLQVTKKFTININDCSDTSSYVDSDLVSLFTASCVCVVATQIVIKAPHISALAQNLLC